MTIQPIEYSSIDEMRKAAEARKVMFRRHPLKRKPVPEPVDKPAFDIFYLMMACRYFTSVNEEPVCDATCAVENIQRVVAKFYGITRGDIISHRRHKQYIMPRQIAGYLAKQMTTQSFMEIARRFGGRDHSTQIYAFYKIARLLETDAALKMDVDVLMAILKVEA